MKKQIKDLELYELDFLVAKAEGKEPKIESNICYCEFNDFFGEEIYSPTTNPSQAWPIIERERIATRSDIHMAYKPIKKSRDFDYKMYGKTSLEAAMRCYAASKFGDKVDLDNLINK
jgi:hypothetical protein